MKKNILFLLLVNFFILCFLSCNADSKNEDKKDDNTDITPITVESDIFILENLSNSLAIKGVKEESLGLEEITIPVYISEVPVSVIRKNALSSCEQLKKIFFQDDVEIKSLVIEPFAFSSLPNLESCIFPDNYNPSSIPDDEKLSLAEIFDSCPKLKEIIFSGFSEEELQIVSSSYPLGVEMTCNEAESEQDYIFNYVFNSSNTIEIRAVQLRDTSTPLDVIVPEQILGADVVIIAGNAFSNQKNIRSIKLPSTITSIGVGAFDNCENLEMIICHNFIKNLNYSFPLGVEVTYYPEESDEGGGDDGGGSDSEINAICFESDEQFSVQFDCKNCDGKLYYSAEYESELWMEWDGGNIQSFYSESDKKYRIYLRGKGNTRLSSGDVTRYSRFLFEGDDIACFGNIMALLEWDNTKNAVMGEYAFSYLFFSSPITSAPSLPALELSKGCYSYMFSDCVNLKSAPALPARKLAHSCYYAMFQGCCSISTAPALPALELEDYCYYSMFCNCDSLYELPSLNATVMKPYCYAHMFKDCSYGDAELTAPPLPAKTLAKGCYEGMFRDSYFKILPKVLPATILAEECYKEMFAACYAKEPPSIMAEELADECCEGMFRYCYSLKKIPLLRATELKVGCYKNMFGESGVRVSLTKSDVYTNEYKLGTYDASSSDALYEMFAKSKGIINDNGAFFGTPSSGQTLWTSAEIVE